MSTKLLLSKMINRIVEVKNERVNVTLTVTVNYFYGLFVATKLVGARSATVLCMIIVDFFMQMIIASTCYNTQFTNLFFRGYNSKANLFHLSQSRGNRTYFRHQSHVTMKNQWNIWLTSFNFLDVLQIEINMIV